jgi:hypothetical protein
MWQDVVRYYTKGVYGNISPCGARKNKPKQTQSRLAPSTAGGLKTYLKKQTQFRKGTNEHKCLLKREIRLKFAISGCKKTKPISRLCHCRPMAWTMACLAFSVTGS